MNITLNNGGEELQVNVPNGTELGHIRTLTDELEEIGAPSSYSLAVDGRSSEDSVILQPGATITFRPISSQKG